MVRHIVALSWLLMACETTEVAITSRDLLPGETAELKNLALRQIDDSFLFPVTGEMTKDGWVQFANLTIDVSANCIDGIRPLGGDPAAGLVCDQVGGPAILVAEGHVRSTPIRNGSVWQYQFLPHVEMQRIRDHAYVVIVAEPSPKADYGTK
jgi:hypothetical protein